MTLALLMDWVCQRCKAVTSGRKEKPRPCCKQQLAFRIHADNPPYTLPPRRDGKDGRGGAAGSA